VGIRTPQDVVKEIRRGPIERRPGVAWIALTLSGYSAVAVWQTWPLAARATTDLPNPGIWPLDILTAAWLLAWNTHALTTHPSLLPHPNAFHPSPYGLFYGPPALGPLPLFAPVYLAFGSVSLASDFAYLAGMTLAAFGIAEVVRRWTDNRAAAFLAGLVVPISPAVHDAVGTAPLCTMLAGLPWLVYAGAQRHPDKRTGALLVGALVLQGLVDPVFALLAALVPLSMIACVRIARPATRRAGWWLVSSMALTGAILSPLLVGYVVAWRGVDPSHAGPWSGAIWTALSEALKLSASSPSASPASTALGIAWIPLVIVTAGVVSAACRGALGAPGWRHAALWTGVGFVVMLPRLPPFDRQMLRHLDLLDSLGPFRSLGRLTTDMLVGVPLLLGLAAAELLGRVRALGPAAKVAHPFLVTTALALTLTFGAPSGPYRTFRGPTVPVEVRGAIARSGGPVLELPGGGPVQQAVAMYRSIGEWWPLVNGYASFWPPGFAERLDAIDRLPDRDALEWLVAETGVRTVIVSLRRLPGEKLAVWTASDAPARAGLLRVARARSTIVFSVTLPSPTTSRGGGTGTADARAPGALR